MFKYNLLHAIRICSNLNLYKPSIIDTSPLWLPRTSGIFRNSSGGRSPSRWLARILRRQDNVTLRGWKRKMRLSGAIIRFVTPMLSPRSLVYTVSFQVDPRLCLTSGRRAETRYKQLVVMVMAIGNGVAVLSRPLISYIRGHPQRGEGGEEGHATRMPFPSEREGAPFGARARIRGVEPRLPLSPARITFPVSPTRNARWQTALLSSDTHAFASAARKRESIYVYY